MSIRKMLENEAKKHLEKGWLYHNEKWINLNIFTEFNLAGPVIALNKETEKISQKLNASNLPYLHRNPAI